MNIFNNTVLVTGAASGIGQAIATQFVSSGYQVVFTDINMEQVSEAVAGNTNATALQLDVTDRQSWDTAIQKTLKLYGRLNCIVNNAGIGQPMNIEELDEAHWQSIMDINLKGTMLGCQFGTKVIKEYGGSIINISSVLGQRPVAEVPAYGASKAAVINLTKSTALWCAQQGYPLRCNAILPGYIRTTLMEKALQDAESPKELLDYFAHLHPMNRLGTPEEIAKAAEFLHSDNASFMTGAIMAVDGGNTI
ncbi:MAG: NAD(P)-dependent dehydrogenase (short-subunit alcohol dehydrogenase family) [Shewanella sp.]